MFCTCNLNPFTAVMRSRVLLSAIGDPQVRVQSRTAPGPPGAFTSGSNLPVLGINESSFAKDPRAAGVFVCVLWCLLLSHR